MIDQSFYCRGMLVTSYDNADVVCNPSPYCSAPPNGAACVGRWMLNNFALQKFSRCEELDAAGHERTFPDVSVALRRNKYKNQNKNKNLNKKLSA